MRLTATTGIAHRVFQSPRHLLDKTRPRNPSLSPLLLLTKNVKLMVITGTARQVFRSLRHPLLLMRSVRRTVIIGTVHLAFRNLLVHLARTPILPAVRPQLVNVKPMETTGIAHLVLLNQPLPQGP